MVILKVACINCSLFKRVNISITWKDNESVIKDKHDVFSFVTNAGNRWQVFFKSVKMVLDMSLQYWLYLQRLMTDFSHIADIRCQLNALSGKVNLMDVAVLIFKLCPLKNKNPLFFGTACTSLWVTICIFKWKMFQNENKGKIVIKRDGLYGS